MSPVSRSGPADQPITVFVQPDEPVPYRIGDQWITPEGQISIWTGQIWLSLTDRAETGALAVRIASLEAKISVHLADKKAHKL